jgi:hypothetical protein
MGLQEAGDWDLSSQHVILPTLQAYSLCDLSLIEACSIIPNSVLFENILVHSDILSRIFDLTC